MNRQKKENLSPQKAMRITHILFYSGLGLMLLGGLVVGGAADNPDIMLLFAVLGFLCAIGGVVFGNLYVRCPDCCGSLMIGGRVPGNLPSYCPHCGKQL